MSCVCRIVQSYPMPTVLSFAARQSMVAHTQHPLTLEAEEACLSVRPTWAKSETCRHSWTQAHLPAWHMWPWVQSPGLPKPNETSVPTTQILDPGSALLLGLLSLLASCRLMSMWTCVTIPSVRGLRPRWSRYRRKPYLRKSPVVPVLLSPRRIASCTMSNTMSEYHHGRCPHSPGKPGGCPWPVLITLLEQRARLPQAS